MGMNAQESGFLNSWILGACLSFVPIANCIMVSESRRKTRETFMIEGKPASDYCVTCCCP